MLYGCFVPARTAPSSVRRPSAFNMAQPSDPKPPAFETAIAIALPAAPAIGAWMIGSSMPSRSVSLLEGMVRSRVDRLKDGFYSGGRKPADEPCHAAPALRREERDFRVARADQRRNRHAAILRLRT